MSKMPYRLRCPICIKGPLNPRLGWEEAVAARQRDAIAGIVATGRTGPRRGRYHRETREVRHWRCGHEWFTTHPDARRIERA